MSGKSLRAVILGGSGNVGSRLVHQLLNTDHSSCLFTSITLISRRPLPQFDHLSSNLLSVRIVEDLNNLENEAVENYDAGFMLLGAGKPSQLSKDELAAIDCNIPVKFGQYCAKSGVRHMSILSALGADKTQDYSWITKSAAGGGWYNHLKGTVEEKFKGLGFDSLSIFQPAAIYPGNDNTPSAFGALNQSLNWLLPGSVNTVSSEEIGTAMKKTMSQQLQGKVTGTEVVSGGHNIRLRSQIEI